MLEHDRAAIADDLEQLLATQDLRRALHEAAWAGRLLLNADASIIFLPSVDCLAAVAWHGREAGDATIDAAASPALKMLSAGRRSVAWETLAHCSDGEISTVLAALGLEGALAVPLRVHGAALGLWLAGCITRRAFSSQDELALATLAENAGLTIESLLLAADNMRFRREADALYQIGQEISELHDLDKVLATIAARASELLQGEISYIALADPEAQVVRVRVTHGTRNDLLRRMVLKYGEGMGGYVAATRTPMLFDNYPDDPHIKPPGVAEIVGSEDIISVLCVPMSTRHRLTGVLYVASRRESVFKKSQIELLSALAAQAAIAIENARLYEAEKVASERLRALNAALEAERSLMRASMITHEQLLKLVLEDQGLQAIADTLAQLLGRPVAVDDHRFHNLCRSAFGLEQLEAVRPVGAAFAEDAELRGQLRMLQRERRAVRFPARPGHGLPHSCLAAPVVAGAAVLGYVWALEAGGELGEQERSTIERAAIVLALEFLKQDAARAAEQRLQRDLLDDLLLGQHSDDATVYQRGARLNVDLRRPHRAFIFDIDDFGEAIRVHQWTDMQALACKRALLSTVDGVLRERAAPSLAGRRGDSVVVLAAEPGGLAEAAALARAVQDALRLSLPDLTVSVGIGRACATVADMPRSYADAFAALHTVRALGAADRAVAFEELGVVPLLLQSENQRGLVAFMERYLRPLIDYDSKHNTQLVETVERYLANNGNLQRTAAACYVHLSSLKYRIARISEITGLDLQDADVRFNLRLALAIRAVLALVAEARA